MNTGPAIPGGWEGHAPPPTFFAAKRIKGNKGNKERVSKQRLSKGCHQGQNVTVLAILERLEYKIYLTILFGVSWPLHFEINFADPGILVLCS